MSIFGIFPKFGAKLVKPIHIPFTGLGLSLHVCCACSTWDRHRTGKTSMDKFVNRASNKGTNVVGGVLWR